MRVDTEQPRRDLFAVVYSRYGRFDNTETDAGFGRFWSRVGFERIRAVPGPREWNQPTQHLSNESGGFSYKDGSRQVELRSGGVAKVLGFRV
jgi:hypothetical protein